MGNGAWKAILVGGLGAAVLSAPFGELAQTIVLFLVSLVSFTSILIGVRIHKPNAKSPWYLLAAGICTLFLSFALRAFGNDDGRTGPVLPDYIVAAGYVMIIVSSHLLRRLRKNDQDPTNLTDSLVFTAAAGILLLSTFMIPYLESPASGGDKIAGLIFAGLDLLLFLTVARLAIGPGARNASYYLMSAAGVSVMVTDIIIDAVNSSMMRSAGESVLLILIPTVGFTLCAVGALHPRMVDITKPATVSVGRLTAARLVTMAIAVLAPPFVVVSKFRQTEDWTYIQYLGPVCALIVVLVLIRFAGMTRARERMADVERYLSVSATALVSATNKDSMRSAALVASSELVGAEDGWRGTVLTLFESGEWVVADHRFLKNEKVSVNLRQCLTQYIGEELTPAVVEASAIAHGPSSIGHYAVVAPLVANHALRGALITFSKRRPSSVIVGALGSLTVALSLALEAATLTEDLHLQRSNRRFRALVENSAELIVVIDNDDQITFMSPTAERLLAGRQGDVRALLATVHDADRLAVLTLLDSARRRVISHSAECRFVDVEGQIFWFEATARDLRDDPEISGIVLNAHDVTGRKEVEEDLRHKVLHDDLTGIANRALLRNRLEHASAGRLALGTEPVIVLIDIDDFKTVNDGLGHGAGDELLQVIAFRLQSFVRQDDTAARLGGDEFAVLLADGVSAKDALEVANRLLDVINEPFEFRGREVTVTASIGVAFASNSHDAEACLRNADVAMYHAKANGKSSVKLFDEAMYLGAIERLELKGDMTRAIERGEMMLYYQPLIDMATGLPAGFEALLRWNHSVRGFVSPVTFIPIAEETGSIIPIGEWVLRQSLQQLANWRLEMPDSSFKMSVNVSPHQLTTDQFVETVKDVLEATGVDPSWVTLELTETAVLNDLGARDRLLRLCEMGLGLAADDFGSGFASYAALQELPFTSVKIDRSLIINFPDSTGKAEAQIRSIVDMAHAIGLTVVAEGIETPMQRDALTLVGCDRGQGFLFGKPLPAIDAGVWLKQASQTPATDSSN